MVVLDAVDPHFWTALAARYVRQLLTLSLEQSGMERLLKCWHKKTDKQSSQRMLSIPYIQICSQNDIHAVLPKLPILTAQCMQ